MHLVVSFLLALFSAAWATKPCGPDTWASRPDRPPEEWTRLATWAVEAKLVARDERIEPFPNCTAKDRKQCAMQDVSIVTFEVLSQVKGGAKAPRIGSRTKLSRGFCAPEPPRDLGSRYRIYGRDAGSYLYLERFDP